MAEAIFENSDLITCPICLDPLTDPVTTACGHSYCMDCIQESWNEDIPRGFFRCPQCMQTFTARPDLKKNTLLTELVDKLKQKVLQASPPSHCYAGPSDVGCNVCTGGKLKAIKSCLVCLVSYCEAHLKLHNDLHQGQTHKLINATGQLKEKICPHHDKLLEVYCRTDQQCICLLCVMDGHTGHDMVTAEEERTEKEKQLEMNNKKSQLRIQEREKEMHELRQSVVVLKRSAQAVLLDSERTLTELIRSIDKKRSEVKELISAEEKAEEGQAKIGLRRLELEVAELRRRQDEFKRLSHTDDHIYFLQNVQSLCVSPGSEAIPRVNVTFHHVKNSVSGVKRRLQDVCKQEIDRIFRNVAKVPNGQHVEPSTREDFLQYCRPLTLDPNTSHRFLSLSDGSRKVTRIQSCQTHVLDHPHRFSHWKQVLCSEGLYGVCYWEVGWTGVDVDVAVSYQGISRKEQGNASWFGGNVQSWRLYCSAARCCFYHNQQEMDVPTIHPFSRVGVYLDHRAGTLSFYSVDLSDTMTLLHRVKTTFTQALFPGFGVGSSVRILTPTEELLTDCQMPPDY